MMTTDQEFNTQENFYMPRFIYFADRYKALKPDAQLLYTILLNIRLFEPENVLYDENHMPYIAYKTKDLSGILGISHATLRRAFRTLEKVNLLKTETKNNQKIAYVFDPPSEVLEEANQKAEEMEKDYAARMEADQLDLHGHDLRKGDKT